MDRKKLEAYFAPVLAWLDAGAPHKVVGFSDNLGFNMNHFVSSFAEDHKGNECGTACCIAGAVTLFNKMRDVFTSPETVGFRLGMDKDDAAELFYANAYCAEGDFGFDNDKFESISPDHAARTIRHYLATGVVDWALNEQVPA